MNGTNRAKLCPVETVGPPPLVLEIGSVTAATCIGCLTLAATITADIVLPLSIIGSVTVTINPYYCSVQVCYCYYLSVALALRRGTRRTYSRV